MVLVIIVENNGLEPLTLPMKIGMLQPLMADVLVNM